MTEEQPSDLVWREEMLADLASGDITRSTTALLSLTYNEPDRLWLEDLLLREAEPANDPQLRALAVICMGHIGRLRGEVSRRVVARLEALLDDPTLGGTAEDALGDIRDLATIV